MNSGTERTERPITEDASGNVAEYDQLVEEYYELVLERTLLEVGGEDRDPERSGRYRDVLDDLDDVNDELDDLLESFGDEDYAAFFEHMEG